MRRACGRQRELGLAGRQKCIEIGWTIASGRSTAEGVARWERHGAVCIAERLTRARMFRVKKVFNASAHVLARNGHWHLSSSHECPLPLEQMAGWLSP